MILPSPPSFRFFTLNTTVYCAIDTSAQLSGCDEAERARDSHEALGRGACNQAFSGTSTSRKGPTVRALASAPPSTGPPHAAPTDPAHAQSRTITATTMASTSKLIASAGARAVNIQTIEICGFSFGSYFRGRAPVARRDQWQCSSACSQHAAPSATAVP